MIGRQKAPVFPLPVSAACKGRGSKIGVEGRWRFYHKYIATTKYEWYSLSLNICGQPVRKRAAEVGWIQENDRETYCIHIHLQPINFFNGLDDLRHNSQLCSKPCI